MKKQKTGLIVIAFVLLIIVIMMTLKLMGEKKTEEAASKNVPQKKMDLVKEETEEAKVEINKDDMTEESIEAVEESVEAVETVEIDETEENIDENDNKKPGEGMVIECWGDSLTYGFNGDGVTYPGVLAELSGAEVRNHGVSGETSLGIAGRQGGVPLQVNHITLPASGSFVLGDLYDSRVYSVYGEMERPMVRGGELSINPCTIAGVKGRIDWTGADYTDKSGTFVFTRESAGEEVAITTPTTVVTSAMTDQSEDMLVIFIGENGGWENKEDLAGQIQAMVNYSVCQGKYIVCGLTTGTAAERADLEGFMEATFGNKYINLRKYLTEEGLRDAGITPTPLDLANLESGSVPDSLRSDAIHGNSFYYKLVGEQIFHRMMEIGYFE